MKRAIELIQADLNRGETPDLDRIERQTQGELAAWTRKINEKAARLREAPSRAERSLGDGAPGRAGREDRQGHGLARRPRGRSPPDAGRRRRRTHSSSAAKNRIICEAIVPVDDGLDEEEWRVWVLAVAQASDRLEYLVTGRDDQ